jgi:hypothetical protein
MNPSSSTQPTVYQRLLLPAALRRKPSIGLSAVLDPYQRRYVRILDVFPSHHYSNWWSYSRSIFLSDGFPMVSSRKQETDRYHFQHHTILRCALDQCGDGFRNHRSLGLNNLKKTQPLFLKIVKKMNEEILNHIEDPVYLETLYRNNKSDFKKSFEQIYPEIQDYKLAEFWRERLSHKSDPISWGTKNELGLIALLSLIAGILIKFPAIFSIDEEFYYPRNTSIIVFAALTAYFAKKNNLSANKSLLISAIGLISLVYINLLPNNPESNTLILACIHLPLLFWGIFGFSFLGNEPKNFLKKLEFLRFNGDLAVMSGLLLIAGGLMTGITLGLFELIGLKIQEFYFQNIVIFGLPMVPIVAVFLTHNNPQLVNKVSPVIAKLFSPLVLMMLVIYLSAIVISGKDPYNDREFLLIFNLLLVGVMVLIFFSVAENANVQKNQFGTWILLLLAVVTTVVNLIAVSAIIYRISEWGFTPNRIAVLGANVLMLVHLLMVTKKLLESAMNRTESSAVGKSIVKLIPVYLLWAILIVFILPFVFSFQ